MSADSHLAGMGGQVGGSHCDLLTDVAPEAGYARPLGRISLHTGVKEYQHPVVKLCADCSVESAQAPLYRQALVRTIWRGIRPSGTAFSCGFTALSPPFPVVLQEAAAAGEEAAGGDHYQEATGQV